MIQRQCGYCSEQMEIPESAGSERFMCLKCGVWNSPPKTEIPNPVTTPPSKADKTTSILEREVFPQTTKAINSVIADATTDFQPLLVFGMLLLGSGSITTLVGIMMETTNGEFYNTGLLNNRLVTVMIGVGLVISGFVLNGLSIATKTIKSAIQSKSANQ